MKAGFARFLAPLALFEWGSILTYFYFSQRIAAFLHPAFRLQALVTGCLLLATAVCVLFSDDETAGAHDCAGDGCDTTHAKPTLGGYLAFLVLLLPIALAARVSPDGYGAAMIENRGAAETLANVPGAAAQAERPAAPPVYVGDTVAADPSEPAPAVTKQGTVDIPKGWTPPGAPDYSGTPSKDVPEDEYPSDDVLSAKLRAESNVSMRDAAKLPKSAAPLKALNERPNAETPLGTLEDVLKMADSPLHDAGANGLKPSDDGRRLAVEVVDLLVAAQKPELKAALAGKQVEVRGQILAGKDGGVRLLRLLVLCCAADAQPLAVRVQNAGKTTFPPMSWAKIDGKVAFAKSAAGDVPVVVAEKITPISQPAEPYLY